MNIVNFSKVDAHKSIIAKFDVEFHEVIVRDVTLMTSEKGQWISWPSRKYKDKEGKDKYFSYITFHGSEEKIRIEKEIKERLKAFLPINHTTEVPF